MDITATDYKLKYIKYKRKYINLFNKLNHQQGGKKYNYYFVHGTKNLASLKSILKDGKILANKYLKDEQKYMCGDKTDEYVYTNIYFEDLHNLPYMWDFTLIIDPKIMLTSEFIFHKGWGGIPIEMDTNNMDLNIRKIRAFLKDPSELPKLVSEAEGMGGHHHEVLFKDNISLHDNILGIICNSCPNKVVHSLKKLLKKYKYDKKIKVYTENYPFPTLQELYA